jgi:hypothetical protein
LNLIDDWKNHKVQIDISENSNTDSNKQPPFFLVDEFETPYIDPKISNKIFSFGDVSVCAFGSKVGMLLVHCHSEETKSKISKEFDEYSQFFEIVVVPGTISNYNVTKA